jgi:hypothetical protein
MGEERKPASAELRARIGANTRAFWASPAGQARREVLAAGRVARTRSPEEVAKRAASANAAATRRLAGPRSDRAPRPLTDAQRAERSWQYAQRKERLQREAIQREADLAALPMVQAARARHAQSVARVLAGGDTLSRSELAAIVRGPVPATFAPGWEAEEWGDSEDDDTDNATDGRETVAGKRASHTAPAGSGSVGAAVPSPIRF